MDTWVYKHIKKTIWLVLYRNKLPRDLRKLFIQRHRDVVGLCLTAVHRERLDKILAPWQWLSISSRTIQLLLSDRGYNVSHDVIELLKLKAIDLPGDRKANAKRALGDPDALWRQKDASAQVSNRPPPEQFFW